MHRVVVGTDGSTRAQMAVGWAARLSPAMGAELVVVTVWRPREAEIPPERYEQRRGEVQRVLEDEWCEPVRAADGKHRAVVVEGDPRDALLATADDEDADLLVTGARGTGRHPHALHLGSVAHHLAHHTRRPLAFVPESAARPFFERILVGVDGSEGSARAVAWSREVAGALDAEVLAVHSEQPPAEWLPHSDPDSWYQWALERAEGWSAPLREAGVRTRTLVVDHPAVTGLTETALHERADLLVVGARGAGGFPGLRLGSTALRVLHHTGIPVVLVPEPD